MNKKIIGILICTLVIAAFLVPVASSANINTNNTESDYLTINPTGKFAFSKRGFNLDSWGITESIDLAGSGLAILKFFEKYEILPVGGQDEGIVKISNNGGSSWTTLGVVQGYIQDWQLSVFDISEWLGDSVLIGFQFVTGDDFTSQGWNIDKITVEVDSENIFEQDFEEYDTGDIWEDWVIKSELSPENSAPSEPEIDGPGLLQANKIATFTFESYDLDLDVISYYVEWGDGVITDWTDFKPSGTGPFSEEHSWPEEGTYTIRSKARDINHAESGWSEHTIRITKPRDRQSVNLIFIKILERMFEQFSTIFPLLNKIC
jgi:hypothetical protein